MIPLPHRLVPLLCAFAVALPLRAAEPAIIAKARARLGTDAALDAIRTVRYAGTLTTSDASDPKKTATARIEMLYQKPDQQRVTAYYEKFTETTALDSYEGWTRLQDAKTAQWQITLLDADQIKRLRANTWEALGYFRGLEKLGGHLEDKGPATIDGVACEKVALVHDPKIVFFDYFELATGRLVLTETDGGVTIRQQGELMVDGIRFPKMFTSVTKNGDKTQTVTVTYDKITLNETLPADTFRVPPLPRP